MAKSVAQNPILNNPYQEPLYHFSINEAGELDYENVIEGRRPFILDITPVPIRQNGQKRLLEAADMSGQLDHLLNNRVRVKIGEWCKAGYTNTTRITRELLHFWLEDMGRADFRKLFFAQREAVEAEEDSGEGGESVWGGEHQSSLYKRVEAA